MGQHVYRAAKRAALVAVGFLFVACTQSTTPPTSSSDDAACSGKPVPAHRCVGGKRDPRCNTLESGESRWQIDCLRGVADDSPLSAVGLCVDGTVCGAQPAWDEGDCMWGFANEAACEKLDTAPCAWSRACKPKPCAEGDADCNRLVAPEKIGAPCDSMTPCPEGSSCLTITVNVGEPTIGPACVTEPCSVLACAPGRTCAILTSFPGQLVCGR